MMTRMLALVAALAAVACHVSARQVTGPDGSRNWYSIQCSHNPANCTEKAGDVCPNGYETARETHGEAEKPNNLFDTSQGYHSEYEGSILIRCRE